eukprot:Pompholyxophrys_sp_v1_NODE_26_length_3750_cov_7.232206.p5 type:complete len:135 gc:universal NODE_26_length_3750_cov_7.232206:831-427(-)
MHDMYGSWNGVGNSRYYPAGQNYVSRTHNSMLRDAVQAVDTNSCINGIYGPCILARLHYFNISMDIGAEYMHGCSGVLKKLLSLWISPQHRRELWIRPYRQVLDEKQEGLCPPSWMTRIPRALSNHSTFWKASE